MRMFQRVTRNERGAAVMEFALAAPVLFTLVIGVAQMGILFFANAGLQNAVAAGARVAAVFPQPSNDEIIAALNNAQFFTSSVETATPTVTPSDPDEDVCYVDVSMSYTVPLDFLFFETDPVTLAQTRRVFTQPLNPVDCSDDITGSTGGTSSTSTGGTSSTSTGGSTTSGGSTTTGGDSTTSSTGGDGGTTTTTGGTTTSGGTTTTTGGTTTSTGGTSTGSTTTSTTSSTGGSSRGNNGSSGNGNGSSGNGHGNGNH